MVESTLFTAFLAAAAGPVKPSPAELESWGFASRAFTKEFVQFSAGCAMLFVFASWFTSCLWLSRQLSFLPSFSALVTKCMGSKRGRTRNLGTTFLGGSGVSSGSGPMRWKNITQLPICPMPGRQCFQKVIVKRNLQTLNRGFAFLSQNPKGFLPKDIHNSSEITSHSCAGHYRGISTFTATTQKSLHIRSHDTAFQHCPLTHLVISEVNPFKSTKISKTMVNKTEHHGRTSTSALTLLQACRMMSDKLLYHPVSSSEVEHSGTKPSFPKHTGLLLT